MVHSTTTTVNSIVMNLLKKNNITELIGIKIFIFGSALHKPQYSDIDLLIEYDNELVDIWTILGLRDKISNQLSNVLNTTIDICLLTIKENNETEFIVREKGIELPLTMARKG